MKNRKKIKLLGISVVLATTTMVAGVKAFEYQNNYKSDSLNSEVINSEVAELNNEPQEIVLTNDELIENEVDEIIVPDIINDPSNEIDNNVDEIVEEEANTEETIIEETETIDNEENIKEPIVEEPIIEKPIVEEQKPVQSVSMPTTFSTPSLFSGEFSLHSPKPIDFGSHKIENKKKVVTTGFEGDFTIVDARGTMDGWELNVSATPFTIAEPDGGWVEYNPYQLPVGSLTLSSLSNIDGYNYEVTQSFIGPVSETSEGDLTEPLEETLVPTLSLVDADYNKPSINMIYSAIDMGEFVTVATAGAGQGAGEYILQYDANALSLVIDPVTAKVDTTNYPEGVTPYESTITWNLISGPSSGIVQNYYLPTTMPTEVIKEETLIEEETISEDESSNIEKPSIDTEEILESDVDLNENLLETDLVDENELINDDIVKEETSDVDTNDSDENNTDSSTNDSAVQEQNPEKTPSSESPKDVIIPDIVAPKEDEVISDNS